jgi:hypothetical protein
MAEPPLLPRHAGNLMDPKITAAGTPPPSQSYARRLTARRERAERLLRRYEATTKAWKTTRLLIGGLVWEELNAPRNVGILFVIFGLAVVTVVLILAANRLTRSWWRATAAAAYYERRLAYLDDRWSGLGDPGLDYLDPAHPYAADLDLFGPGGLFELLATCRTRAGRDTLASWLLQPASVDEIRDRQAAVAALRDRLDLHEDLALLDEASWLGAETLCGWIDQPVWPGLEVKRVLAVTLAVAALAALIGWLGFDIGPGPLLGTLLFEAGLYYVLRDRLRTVLAPVERGERDLAVYAELLDHWSRERLGDVNADVETGPAGRSLARLATTLRRLPLVPVLGWLLAGTRLALAVEAWRRRHGRDLPAWLAAAGRAEALVALATFSYEHPNDPFPELAEPGPCFEAEGLGHPLLPADRCVRNDLRLGPELRLLVVSGSNMSGKSTLLRTVGANAVLALAGAPVRAKRLRLSPLALGGTLRIQDSLQGGTSRFYAEITRMRQLLDLARGPRPLLFLLDEILHGTNSDDRRAGAEAVIRHLLDRGAVGLVTTHDLALTPIADRLGPATNVHFVDHLEDGKLVFDYRIRPGVVKQSNALALMRAVGIDV